MADVIVTGASRGIGRALALVLARRLAKTSRLVLVARDVARLTAVRDLVVQLGGDAVVRPGDLSSLADARALGRQLAALVEEGATLVHNAGLWPAKRTLSPEGLEAAFVVNHLGPLGMQAPLLDAGALRRVLVVSAGLIVKGRFDAERTPRGDDFSPLRTYCTTKLAFALAMRDVAAERPSLDVLALHPGVVRTDLGARPGPLGWLLRLVKRGWEAPEPCAERLARLLAEPAGTRWSPPGEVRWLEEEHERPWPAAADDAQTRRAVREVTERMLGR
jgi:NAD(P)-dependent dehydrogenase (short-subunit alcohol dehydrogenase family)